MTVPATLDLVQFANLGQLPWVRHGISTRHGGVSEGRCATLNTSFNVGDLEGRVEENLRRLAGAVGADRADLVAAHQVHGRAVTVVDSDTPPGPRCDVLVTASIARTLMLRFADCTPILLADREKRVVAGVHAGWRGTAAGVAGAAVAGLIRTFKSDPRDVVAGIGPAIGPCCYVVGGDVEGAFADRPWAITRADDGSIRLDLWEANRRALVEAGVPVEQIEVSGICTSCQSDRFFSHRANGGQPAGRFAAVIRLTC